MMDTALLIVRLVVGLLVAGHGSQKLFGWFGGHGIKGTAGWLASIGFRPPEFWARAAGLAEFGGGLLLALGLFTPLGSIAVAASMTMAIARVHWPKVWVSDGGMELPLTNLAGLLAVAIAGPGAISLDAALGTALRPSAALAALLVILAGWIWGYTTSRATAKTQAGQPS